MEPTVECQKQAEEIENKTETTENASDRESSIESFHTNKSELSITTETELIDVDDIELSDEESWLYKSPKKLTSEEKSASTQKWLQKNIDDMDDVELSATRSALLSKLNQLKLLNSSVEKKQIKKGINTSSVLNCDLKVENKRTADLTVEEKNVNLKIEERKDIDLKVEKKTTDLKAEKKKASDSKLDEKKTDFFKTFCVTSLVEKPMIDSSDHASRPEKKHTVPETEKYADTSVSEECQKSNLKQEILKKNEVFDVVDVQKIARLQEESLKQSTYKFLSQAGKKAMSSRDLSPASPAQITSLNKPASIEAINTCTDKMNNPNVYSMVHLQGMKKQNMFSSSSALNCSQEFHRGSLPNINKGYYSLKSKKSKRPSEPKVSCPLPVYPSHSKVILNGTLSQGSSDSRVKSAAPSYDHRETRTLPSSYRVHSRSNSSSRRDMSVLFPSPRRESVPFLGSNLSLESNQRENHRKFSSPVPSTTVYPRYSTSSSATVSPTKTFNSQPQNLRSPPGLDYHRAASHSPSRRLPLSTVQHQSPKKGNNLTSPRNGEIRTLKVPSKIPSPALRSGIPVPSTAYTPRANEDDTWSQDCF